MGVKRRHQHGTIVRIIRTLKHRSHRIKRTLTNQSRISILNRRLVRITITNRRRRITTNLFARTHRNSRSVITFPTLKLRGQRIRHNRRLLSRQGLHVRVKIRKQTLHLVLQRRLRTRTQFTLVGHRSRAIKIGNVSRLRGRIRGTRSHINKTPIQHVRNKQRNIRNTIRRQITISGNGNTTLIERVRCLTLN